MNCIFFWSWLMNVLDCNDDRKFIAFIFHIFQKKNSFFLSFTFLLAIYETEKKNNFNVFQMCSRILWVNGGKKEWKINKSFTIFQKQKTKNYISFSIVLKNNISFFNFTKHFKSFIICFSSVQSTKIFEKKRNGKQYFYYMDDDSLFFQK